MLLASINWGKKTCRAIRKKGIANSYNKYN